MENKNNGGLDIIATIHIDVHYGNHNHTVIVTKLRLRYSTKLVHVYVRVLIWFVYITGVHMIFFHIFITCLAGTVLILWLSQCHENNSRWIRIDYTITKSQKIRQTVTRAHVLYNPLHVYKIYTVICILSWYWCHAFDLNHNDQWQSVFLFTISVGNICNWIFQRMFSLGGNRVELPSSRWRPLASRSFYEETRGHNTPCIKTPFFVLCNRPEKFIARRR